MYELKGIILIGSLEVSLMRQHAFYIDHMLAIIVTENTTPYLNYMFYVNRSLYT